ncbi:MAG: Rne/Rng family ribonuclease [Bdellovibrionales bacterium]|nr:Rne/Rng family ribonuclease [Bdellovibrionales bacterium]
MAKELIINATLPEVRIALMDDGQIQELLIERDSEKGIVGNIYKGRVTRVLPGMQAAFVDVGLDKAAFLYVDDIYVHPEVMGEETEVTPEDSETGSEDLSQETGAEASSEPVQESPADQAQANDDFGNDPSQGESMEATHDPEYADVDSSFEEEDGGDLEGGDSDDSDLGEESVDSDDSDEMTDAQDEEQEAGQESDLEASSSDSAQSEASSSEENQASLQGLQGQGGRRGRRGRNRNRRRRGRGTEGRNQFAGGESHEDPNFIPNAVNENLNDSGELQSDRAAIAGETATISQGTNKGRRARPEFREQRGRDRRIKSKALRPRTQANISDLLKEGQEVIVQVAKDPIATKGARLTCHVSLPGRHLVCMPSIDHVGVSRRIEREDERRRLRDFVEKNRPRKMGFIVRTASGGKDPESWIKQDIDYLSKLWTGIRTKADDVSAPALVYEDLNSTLRAIRDWVNEDVDHIVVDTRYHYNELISFAERFMPTLIDKIELYQGDIPVFDAYGLSSELHRSMERKVWLKSGGYIVIDQAEALVAIDVNTGRFVGKKNLEDTILKTNLEAAEEIAYQLRLRNCGGIIIVDFIDMEREDNKMRVYRALDEALKKDRARPTIQKISELGLVEMTRKRTRDTLVRTLCEPCTHCEGRGYTKTHSTVAYEILREVERMSVDRDSKKILVSAHESVINILAIELRDALDQLERRYNKSVYLQALVDFHGEQFEVVSDRMPSKKPNQDIARQLRIERERSERKDKGKQRRQERNERGDRTERNERPERNERHAGSRNDSIEVHNPQSEAPKAPVIRPSGSFIAAKPAPIQPRKSEGEAGLEQSPGSTGTLIETQDEDRQPDFQSVSQPNATSPDFSEMDDEDQLAYLRAQAAQDAAIAGLGSAGAVPGAGGGNSRHSRGQNFRGQQNQGNQQGNNRGGRNQHRNRNRNHNHNQDNQGNRGGRYRPQVGNLNAQAMDARPRSGDGGAEVVVPDYEVMHRPGDGSET